MTELSTFASALVARALASDADIRGRARLGEVIRQRSFQPVFQPIVELADRTRVGFEALPRYDDGTQARDRAAYAAFVGLAADLERAVLELVVESSPRLPGGLWLSIDLSPAVLCSGDGVAALLQSVERPVIVELTERDAVEDYGALRSALRTLGRRIRVAVDDVGSGYAGLRHVLSLQPAFVKLDPAWVRGVEDDAARQP